ncbi:hypothetical protein ES703_11320 [subsurface metagenome]
MDYIAYISTPKENNEANPLITPLRLSRGRLVGGFLYFPRGPSGYLHFIARIGVHQILPYNAAENYRLNRCIVPLHLDIDFFQPPYIIDCVTWNDSADYAHVLTVGFFLDPFKKPRTGGGIISTMINAVTGYKTGGDRKI